MLYYIYIWNSLKYWYTTLLFLIFPKLWWVLNKSSAYIVQQSTTFTELLATHISRSTGFHHTHTHTHTHIYIYIYIYIYVCIYEVHMISFQTFSYGHVYWQYTHETLVPFEVISSGCNALVVPFKQLLEGLMEVLLCEHINDLRHSLFHLLNCLIMTVSELRE